MSSYPLIKTSLSMIDVICLYSSHLADLESLTYDVLHETYCPEKLSRRCTPKPSAFFSIIPCRRPFINFIIMICSTSSDLPEELATQSVRLMEEQLRGEEEKDVVPSSFIIICREFMSVLPVSKPSANRANIVLKRNSSKLCQICETI